MSQEYRRFTDALLAMGPTDSARAKQLGVPVRTFADYKAHRFPRGMRRLMRPELLRALAEDIEASEHQPSERARQLAA